MIEILGYIATISVLVSMMFKNIKHLRFTNSIACLLWVWYGTLIHNNPTIIVNSAILIIHIHWFIKTKRNESLGM